MFTSAPSQYGLIIDSRNNGVLIGTSNMDVITALVMRKSFYRLEIDWMNNSHKQVNALFFNTNYEFDKTEKLYRMVYNKTHGNEPSKTGRHYLELIPPKDVTDEYLADKLDAHLAEVMYANVWQNIMSSLTFTPPENDMAIRFYPELRDAINECDPATNSYVQEIVEYGSFNNLTPEQSYDEICRQLLPIRKQRIRAYAMWTKYVPIMMNVELLEDFRKILIDVKSNVRLGAV